MITPLPRDEHMRAELGAGKKDAAHIGVHDAVEFLSAEIFGGFQDRDALRAHENVDMPEILQRGRNQRIELLVARRIAGIAARFRILRL